MQPRYTQAVSPASDTNAVGEDADDPEANEAMMREVLQDYLAKAQAYKTDLGDKRLTVEHMVLAMAEVRGCRFV